MHVVTSDLIIVVFQISDDRSKVLPTILGEPNLSHNYIYFAAKNKEQHIKGQPFYKI